jgi:hypothetical protein
MSARPSIGNLSAIIGLAAMSACAPVAEPGQVATRIVAPPSKNAYVLRNDNAVCTRQANGYVRVFAECMEQRGNRVELFGPGGAPISIASLALPPASLPPSSQLRRQQPGREIRPSVPSEESIKYSRLLDRLVAEDSQSWAVNSYDQGSMKNAVIQQWANGEPSKIKGYYTYNKGKPGSVVAELVNGRLSCISYWDFPDECRKLGQGIGKQLEAAAAEAARNERLHPSSQPAPSQSEEPGLPCSFYLEHPMMSAIAGCP